MKTKFFLLLFLFLSAIHVTYCQQEFQTNAAVQQAISGLAEQSQDAAKVRLILQLSVWYSKTEMPVKPLDSALLFANKALELSNNIQDVKGRACSYLQLSRLMQNREEYKKGKAFALNSIEIFNSLNEYDLLGEAYVMLWSTCSLDGLAYKERIPILFKAAVAFQRSGNKSREADCDKEMGDLYQFINDASDALPVLKHALELYKASGNKRLQGIYDLLGTTHVKLGDYRAGVQYGLLAARAIEETGDSSLSVCTYYNRLGMAYAELNDLERANFYFDKALKLANSFNDVDVIFNLVFNKTDLLFNKGKPDDALAFINKMRQRYPKINTRYKIGIACLIIPIYLRLNLYREAAPYYHFLEQRQEKGIKIEGLDFKIYERMISFNIHTGNFKKASEYNTQYGTLAHKSGKPLCIAKNYLFRFKIDSATGNYLTAIKYYQQYKTIRETVFDAEKERTVSQLSISYETEKKEKDIELLTKETQLQAANIKQGIILQRVTYLGLILLFLIVVGLVYGYIIKQQTNKKLRLQKEEIDLQNYSLQRLIREKEWLVKEIHHRVKNNLHMVVGLLASKTEFIKGEEAYEALTESQHRVQAMSLIHQKLYQTENLSTIDMPSYVLELVEYLQSSFGKKNPIRFSLDIAKVAFPLSHSIPIGLILNEAITNAINYAFPDGRHGMLKIILERKDDQNFILLIEDDGIGVPENINLKKSSSLGMTLIQGLSDDIGGVLKITADNGVSIKLSFKLDLN